MGQVRRIYVEKKAPFAVHAKELKNEIKEYLGLSNLEEVRVFVRYDVENVSEETYRKALVTVFSEPPIDDIYEEVLPVDAEERVFSVEFLPGQFDQRADSAEQCVKLLKETEEPIIRTATTYALKGKLTDEEFEGIVSYCINPVDSRRTDETKPETLISAFAVPEDVKIFNGFMTMPEKELKELYNSLNLAMTFNDFLFIQQYFAGEEKRDPSMTEIRVLDTYWSDHCRHTTFTTAIDMIDIQKGYYSAVIERAYQRYIKDREELYAGQERVVTLMDIAVIGMKYLRQQGKLDDLDQSEEINACSIVVKADIDGHDEDWLVMFKNETHNHPTEIEPFGGAATCLGGAIRDPLSGRSYVYQAMRLTGAADPRRPISETIAGKLPQKKITLGAAAGYSSYGNQIGLATGQVAEVYHEGFTAKRMEIGAVIAAAPKENVIRKRPEAGDIILLVGGRTGRDGCGGATGASKEHTINSLSTCSAEVQKGNPPTERKIQRLFRNPKVSRMIKRCNDFGAGGVSVAIGELAEGLVIELDRVPKKYEGLDGTELAISESQERMAVVIDRRDLKDFIDCAGEENLEATPVAAVVAVPRLIMHWRGKEIVNISRAFLDTNGVQQHVQAKIACPDRRDAFFEKLPDSVEEFRHNLEKAWIANLSDINVCSQKGLCERFDSTIGAGTVVMPFGGKNQLTPAEGMVAKLPVLHGETTTATAMAYGYNPQLMSWSPFHGAVYSIVEAMAKLVAMGAPPSAARLTLQEYFESLGKDSRKWGKPLSALLGALWAQHELGVPAIGGKDSMSGTFMDLTVPPTLAAFAVAAMPAEVAVSAEFKYPGSNVYYIPAPKNTQDMPVFARLKQNFAKVHELIMQHKVLAAASVRTGGMAAAVSKMCLGNGVGFKFSAFVQFEQLFKCDYGAIIIEVPSSIDVDGVLNGSGYYLLGVTTGVSSVVCGQAAISLAEIEQAYCSPLEGIFPTTVKAKFRNANATTVLYTQGNKITPRGGIARPHIFIPVFPGTNCEYDSARAFERAGGEVETLVVKNLTPAAVEETIAAIEAGIRRSQIVMFPGGFSGGDEPDGSGKFIAAMFRNPRIAEAVMSLLKTRDGLMLGICNGFQALIKLGLVPYGTICDLDKNSPTLTHNQIGRHVSRMVQTKVVSNLSPWFNNVNVGDMHTIAVSHGEGRFVADKEVIAKLRVRGQIATQYVDPVGNPSMEIAFNPNGSVEAIEGITSPDGRILGKMGHSERIGQNVCINVPGAKDQQIFEAGVRYYK